MIGAIRRAQRENFGILGFSTAEGRFSSSLAEEVPSLILNDRPQNPKRLGVPPQLAGSRGNQVQGLPLAHPNPKLRHPKTKTKLFFRTFFFEKKIRKYVFENFQKSENFQKCQKNQKIKKFSTGFFYFL